MALTASPSSRDPGVDPHAWDVSSLSACGNNRILELFSRHYLLLLDGEVACAR